MRNHVITFLLTTLVSISAYCSHLKKARNAYYNLDLTSALSHLANAETHLKQTDKPADNSDKLAAVYFIRASTYFFLSDLKRADLEIGKALQVRPDCTLKNFELPKPLQKTCEAKLEQLEKKQAERNFLKLVDIPSAIAAQNNLLEKKIVANQNYRTAGYTLWGASSIPLGLGVGFSLSALNAKDTYLASGTRRDRLHWKRDAIIADISFSIAALTVVTGLVLYICGIEFS